MREASRRKEPMRRMGRLRECEGKGVSASPEGGVERGQPGLHPLAVHAEVGMAEEAAGIEEEPGLRAARDEFGDDGRRSAAKSSGMAGGSPLLPCEKREAMGALMAASPHAGG